MISIDGDDLAIDSDIFRWTISHAFPTVIRSHNRRDRYYQLLPRVDRDGRGSIKVTTYDHDAVQTVTFKNGDSLTFCDEQDSIGIATDLSGIFNLIDEYESR